MNARSIETATSPMLRHSKQALERAATRAREIAIRTNTLLVVKQDGLVVHLNPRTMQVVAQASSK